MGRKVFLVVILVAVVAVVAGSLVCVRKARAYGGDSWCGAFTSEQPILSGDYWTNGVDIAARDNHVYVVATPHVPGMNGVWFRRSDDYGSHWGNWIRVYESPPWDKCCPQIECGGADHSLYVAFNGHYNESSRGADIAVYKSGDNGDSWGLYHLLASYYNGTNLQEYIRPCLSSSPGSHNHVLLAYGDEWYDSALHGGYYASHVNIFQLENGSRNKGEGTLVSGGVWNFDIRCSVTGSGTYWVTWKEGNVSNGDIYTSHVRHIDGWPHWEYLENHTLLASSSSYPDISALAGGVCVTYNRWDGQNNWAGQRVNFGTGWWGEGLMGNPTCNGGGYNHIPRLCQNSTHTPGSRIDNWCVFKSGFTGHFWGFAGRDFDQGSIMDLSHAGWGADPYSFDICTNEANNYFYMAATDWHGSVYVKRGDDPRYTSDEVAFAKCDSVRLSNGSGHYFGGNLYTNTNFDVSFKNVRDDWDVTGGAPPWSPSADYYTRGVTSLEVHLNVGGRLTTMNDDADHDGNWGTTVDVSGRPDGDYYSMGFLRDTAGTGGWGAWSPVSNHAIVDRIAPSGSLSFSGYSGGGEGEDEVYTNKDFNVSFNATDNVIISGKEDGGTDQFTDGVTSIDMKYASSPDAAPEDWSDLPTSAGIPRLDNAPWTSDVKVGVKPNLEDGIWYIKGIMTDVAGNTSEAAPRKLIVDTVAPDVNLPSTLRANDNGWFNKDATVSFDIDDANPGQVEYEVNKEGAGRGGRDIYTGPFALKDGEYTVTYRATDKAGNVSDTKSENIKVDTLSPSCAVTEPTKDFIQIGFTKDQTAKVSGFAEDGGSGVASESLFMGSEEIAKGKGGTISCEWKVADAKPGIYEVKVVSTDNAGNTGTSTKRVNVANFCKDWYFAEGNTLAEFDEWLCIANPGEENACVRLSFMMETGEVITRDVLVAGKARTTYNVKQFVPEGHQGVSTYIHCDNQAIIAERAMYFNYKVSDPNRNWKGGHASLGLTTLQKEFYFAEGTTRSNANDGQFDEWLTMQNPGGKTATMNITYMLEDGRNIYKQYKVGPHSRLTVDVRGDVGKEQDVSARVLSDEPIAAERPMYFDYHGYAKEGHNVVGTSSPATDWLFAEGNTLSTFQMWLTVQNPNDVDAHLSFRYLTDQGKVIDVKRTVGPRSRWTEDVLSDVGDSQNFSTEIQSDVPIVCERPMYFDYKGKWSGGHDAMGSKSLSTKFYVAEGTTIENFETWYTIGNPNGSEANVKITFMSGSGDIIPREYAVAPHSRLTIDVNAEVGQGKDISSCIESDKPVMVERPMYFNYHGARDGGSDAPAYGVD